MRAGGVSISEDPFSPALAVSSPQWGAINASKQQESDRRRRQDQDGEGAQPHAAPRRPRPDQRLGVEGAASLVILRVQYGRARGRV